MFSEIAEIKYIREQRLRILKREKELTRPILLDYNLIPEIYTWFKECVVSNNISEKNTITQRKKFLLVILWLYSPGSLAGDKMKPGLRDVVAKTLDIKQESVISRNCNSLVFTYRTYKYFRRDVDVIIEYILSKIENTNHC